MTEASEDGSYLVRVRAQVMTRDDSSGGWVPLSGGGLANVSVCRRLSSGYSNKTGAISGGVGINSANTFQSQPTAPANGTPNHGSTSTSPPDISKRRYEYLIYGKRIADQSLVLSCTIKQDFEYNRVMPTFHHWRTGEKKFGLTFQTTADARTFAQGVRCAVQELLQGFTESIPYSNDTDDDVFMTLNLPVDPSESRQLTEGRNVLRMPPYRSPDFSESQKPIQYISGASAKLPSMHYVYNPADGNQEAYPPYVQLGSLNCNQLNLYPVLDEAKKSKERSNTTSSLKKPDIIDSQPTKLAEHPDSRIRCKHCHELYTAQQNPRGSCKFAPNCIKQGIDYVSCFSCAKCMLYYCVSDVENELAQNPCSCSVEEGCGRRWLGLALLSLVFPCLWMYAPLRAVYWCGTSCGVCGGKHHPSE